jgi:hypothetical protein
VEENVSCIGCRDVMDNTKILCVLGSLRIFYAFICVGGYDGFFPPRRPVFLFSSLLSFSVIWSARKHKPPLTESREFQQSRQRFHSLLDVTGGKLC